jgi:pSer/pThr/pTyr-binding forkhead associated (FHA) protein
MKRSKGPSENPLADTGLLWLNPNLTSAEPLQVNLNSSDGFVIGRSDARSTFVPDVDLANYKALERGISRRHATFIRNQGALHLIDLHSINGTFINGNRLQPDIPYPLHNGDLLKFGDLSMTIASPPD